MPEAENLKKRVGEAHQKVVLPSETTPGETPVDSHADTELVSGKPDTAKRNASLIGQVIGGAEIIDDIGSGGMGDVYLGMLDGQKVAVKLLQRRYVNNKSVVQRFAEESKATTTLRHPHIVETIKSGVEDGTPYLIGKFIEGSDGKKAPTLEDATKGFYFTLEQNAGGLLQIAKALQYAHSTDGKPQIISRDVKHRNILVKKDPLHWYLIDFGIGKIVEDTRESVTEEKSFLGTPDYMSPEQAADAKDVGPESDVYSWACAAYFAFSHIRPTEKRTPTVEEGTHAERMEIARDRSNEQINHELSLNEAIEEGFKEVTANLDPKKAKAAIDGIRNRMGRLSEEAEEDFMRVLDAKKADARPPFSKIIPRLEERIQKNSVRARELTPEEKEEKEAIVLTLRNSVKKGREELAKLPSPADVKVLLEKRYHLGQTLAELADVLPCGDGSRESLYKEALDHFSGVYAQVDIDIRNGIKSELCSIQEVKDEKSWAASGINIVQKRKLRSESKMSEQQYEELFDKANKALDGNALAEAAECYSRIDHAKVPNVSKTKLASLTMRFEELIEKIIGEGKKAADGDVEKAEAHYNNAKLLSDVLHASSECRKQVAGFSNLIAFGKDNQLYVKAEKEGDFYTMLKKANDMVRILDKADFSADEMDKCRKLAESYLDALKPKKRQIGMFEELYKGAHELTDELSKERKDDVDTHDISIRSLSEERINYYNKTIKEISDEFETLKQDNIGPKYDELKIALGDFKEELQVEIWKRGVGKEVKERNDSLNSLINYFNEKGMRDKELSYLRVRMIHDKKRAEDLLDNK